MNSFDKALFIIIGVAIGAAIVYYIVRSRIPATKYVVSAKTSNPESVKEINNTETWDMFEDENGHLRVTVKRKVTHV